MASLLATIGFYLLGLLVVINGYYIGRYYLFFIGVIGGY
jgi:hypothetical protein